MKLNTFRTVIETEILKTKLITIVPLERQLCDHYFRLMDAGLDYFKRSHLYDHRCCVHCTRKSYNIRLDNWLWLSEHTAPAQLNLKKPFHPSYPLFFFPFFFFFFAMFAKRAEKLTSTKNKNGREARNEGAKASKLTKLYRKYTNNNNNTGTHIKNERKSLKEKRRGGGG